MALVLTVTLPRFMAGNAFMGAVLGATWTTPTTGAALLQLHRCSKRPALPAASMSDKLDGCPVHATPAEKKQDQELLDTMTAVP